jgi:hypothetical protein
VIGNAVLVMRIAMGQVAETDPAAGKDPPAVALGKRGGAARATSLTKKQRSEIAEKAAKSRWRGQK